MKQTTQSTGLTSFHGSTVKATVNEMKEVLGNVMYYGIKKVDSLLLSSKKKLLKEDINSLEIRKGGLYGKYKNLKKKIEIEKLPDEKKKLTKELELVKNEVNLIGETIKKLKEKNIK